MDFWWVRSVNTVDIKINFVQIKMEFGGVGFLGRRKTESLGVEPRSQSWEAGAS